MTAIGSLIPDWRHRAEVLRRHGAAEAAMTADTLADELEAALRSEAEDTLTLEQAAAESGFSRDHLARLIREGKLASVGKPRAPRIRHADLPRKSGRTLLAAGRIGNVASVRGRMARVVAHSTPGAIDGTH